MTNDRSCRCRSSAADIGSRVRYARLLPSGDHSYADTPSGAVVKLFGAPPVTGTANTCGLGPAKPRTESIVPSGDQRSCGRGTGTLKMRIVSPTRFGWPPPDGMTNSSASCPFSGSDGVDTTDATCSPSGEIRTSRMARSLIRSSTVTDREAAAGAPDEKVAHRPAQAAVVRNRVFMRG